MDDKTPILKDEDHQRPIPSVWRDTFTEIVEALKKGDYEIINNISGVCTVSTEDASRITRNIEGYGVQLTSLPEETWQTSVCQWMKGYWDVMIDLYSIEEGASDLILSVRVYEKGSSYIYEIQSVHVP